MSEKYYLGIDIGTYETKGVLVNIRGEVISQSAKKHEMIVPQSGWAEHRPIEAVSYTHLTLPTSDLV